MTPIGNRGVPSCSVSPGFRRCFWSCLSPSSYPRSLSAVSRKRLSYWFEISGRSCSACWHSIRPPHLQMSVSAWPCQAQGRSAIRVLHDRCSQYLEYLVLRHRDRLQMGVTPRSRLSVFGCRERFEWGESRSNCCNRRKSTKTAACSRLWLQCSMTGFPAIFHASFETCSGDASMKPPIFPPLEKCSPTARITMTRTRESSSSVSNANRS